MTGFAILPVAPTTEQPTNPVLPTTSTTDAESIIIAAWNIQVLGQTKMANKPIVDVITTTAHRFDVLAVQEIRDKEGLTIPALQQALTAKGHSMRVIASPPLGRTTSKEQYAIFYDPTHVSSLGWSEVYPDPRDDFEREPLATYLQAGNLSFILVVVHIKPDDAASEIAHLADVVAWIASENPAERDIILLGDLNADGSYLDENSATRPLSSAQYQWLLGNEWDTTVAASENTYDRIIVTPSIAAMQPTVGVDRFDTLYGPLTVTPNSVSDHYPVWIKLPLGDAS